MHLSLHKEIYHKNKKVNHMSKKILSQTLKTVLENYLQSLKKDQLPINKAFLFGSYAKGHARQDSDVDVCIISPNFSNPIKAIQYLLSKRELNLRYPIEPIGFHPKDFRSDMSIIQEIKKTGIRIL